MTKPESAAHAATPSLPERRVSVADLLVTDHFQPEAGKAEKAPWRSQHAQPAHAEIGENLRADAVAAPFPNFVLFVWHAGLCEAFERARRFIRLGQDDDNTTPTRRDVAQCRGDGDGVIAALQMQHVGQGV